MLADAKAREDISVEDLNESFYISYEMAAHRLTNLITRHFDIPVHFQRSDPEGLLWKAYENDGVLLPSDLDGTIEGQRLCRWWSSRQAFESEDSYSLHYQYTETVAGTFWCATHIGVESERGDAITIGTAASTAHWFRGSDTTRRAVSRCPDPSCCRRPPAEAVRTLGGSGLAVGPRSQPLRVGTANRHRGLQSAPGGGPHRRVLVPRSPYRRARGPLIRRAGFVPRIGVQTRVTRRCRPADLDPGGVKEETRGPQNRPRTGGDAGRPGPGGAAGVVPVPAGRDRPAGARAGCAMWGPSSRPS